MKGALRIIADDLTGACDVAAAFLPWPGGIVVRPALSAGAHRAEGIPDTATAVRNTQSRTRPVAEATAAVCAALADVEPGWRGIVFKKIDTGLRGPLGAEIDAAMTALGIDEAFVLPAIPEVGRTTENGQQLIGGTPVHLTAFARDPQNPVADADVGAVIASGTPRRAASVGLDAVRSPAAFAAALDAARASGAAIVVCDAQTDDDLEAAVRGLLARPRPLLLVGSIGLAGALRRVLAVEKTARRTASDPQAPGRGALVVVGSAHPVAHAQVEQACAAQDLDVAVTVDLAAPERSGTTAARALAAGRSVALTAPADGASDSTQVLAAIRRAAFAALDRARPGGLVLVGGETAFEILAGLGHPSLWVESRPFPLVVRSSVLGGSLAGLPLVTKGGSSGATNLLAQVLRQMRREVRV